jgi:hypothetical protein
MCGARETVPEPLSDAIAAMIDVFASRAEHDVGGWAVPYFLTTDGPRFVSYCYSVSDPLFDRLAPSALIPHGTQEEGGSSLSVTELGDDEGMVVYWLQLPGGTVLIRNADGYEAHFFPGRLSEFKTAGDAALNRAIELWVGDQPLRPVRRLRMMRDANGALTCALADDGGGMSLAIYNLATPFHSRAELTMNNALSANTSPIGVEVTEEKNSVRLKCRAPQGAAVDVNLTASELDAFLLQLAQARAELSQQVPLELAQGTTINTQLNPCWRTWANVHPQLPGIVLNMRHSGYGWLGFLMPHNEAQGLGSWLVQHAQQTNRPA